ncbi:MAG: hypothetical protein FWE12_02510 [Oscillospiraceae bacterium]|nr:hypothetical protein [Oscillospiraceae bacterium]
MTADKKDILALKLQLELESPSELFSRSFLEDIYSVLTLSEWSEDMLLRLIKTPNLLQKVGRVLHNDDVFSVFFEQRTRELIVELITE